MCIKNSNSHFSVKYVVFLYLKHVPSAFVWNTNKCTELKISTKGVNTFLLSNRYNATIIIMRSLCHVLILCMAFHWASKKCSKALFSLGKQEML